MQGVAARGASVKGFHADIVGTRVNFAFNSEIAAVNCATVVVGFKFAFLAIVKIAACVQIARCVNRQRAGLAYANAVVIRFARGVNAARQLAVSRKAECVGKTVALAARLRWRQGRCRNARCRNVGYGANGRFQQAHAHDRWPSGHEQAPFAGAVAKRSGQALRTLLQVKRRHGAGFAGGQRQGHRPGASALVVNAGDAHALGVRPGVHKAQLAGLPAVAARVEHPHHKPPLGVPWQHVVHGGEEPVPSADEGQHLHVLQGGFDGQAPMALVRQANAVDALGRVAVRQVVGVEVEGLVGRKPDFDGVGGGARVVNGGNANRAGFAGFVDDAHEALPLGVRGQHQRNGDAGVLRMAQGRQQHGRGQQKLQGSRSETRLGRRAGRDSLRG